MPNLVWISKAALLQEPPKCKNGRNCNILAGFRPSVAIKHMLCCYTSFCVDMIREFAHAADFAAARRYLRFLFVVFPSVVIRSLKIVGLQGFLSINVLG